MKRTHVNFSKKNSFDLYHYILLGVAFLSSGHVYSVTKGNLCHYILFGALCFMLVKISINRSIRIMNKKLLIIPIFILITFIIDMIMNFMFNYNLLYSIRFFTILIFSYIFTMEMNFEAFRKIYVKCMTIMSAIGLIGFVIGSFSGFYYNLPTITNINGISYYDAFVFFGMNDFSRGRNIGVFWEPGIFAIFITLAVLFLLFDRGKLNRLQISILILTLFSTLSTTGYFLIAIIFFSITFLRKKQGLMKLIFLIFFAFFAIFALFNSSIIFNSLSNLFPRVFTKLIDNSASTVHRLDSIKYNFEIFIKSPIWGSGLVKTNLLFSEITNGTQTSTMTLYLAQFGLLGLIYILAQFTAIAKYSSWSRSVCILFCITWLILLNVEIVTFFPLIYIISFYFIKGRLLSTASIKQEVYNNIC